MKKLFTFPDPVNETSARIVAAGVVILTTAYLATGVEALAWVIAYGFWARLLTGPTLSPLGLLATRVITPRWQSDHALVPGPPKRFAQGIGVVLSTGAVVAVTQGLEPLAMILVAAITAAAALEAGFGYCLGCVVFNQLMQLGLIPRSICEACAEPATTLGPITPRTVGRT